MKLKASSIIEVLVALVIIILVFGSSTAMYIQLIHHRPEKSYRLLKELSALASEIKEESTPAVNSEYESEDGLTILQYCEPYKGDGILLYLKLEAVEDGKVVALHEELFIRKEDVL